MIKTGLSLFLLFLGVSDVFTQTKLPYKPYIVAGRVSLPYSTSDDNFVIMQETVASFPTEYDILMYSIREDLMYNLTDDHKSTFSVIPPNSAVDPSGKWLLFYSFRNKKNGIYIQNLWTGETIQVTPNADPYFLCSWSPDGSKVLFGEESGLINTPNSVVRVFDVLTKTSESFVLTDNEDYTVIRGHSNPAWSADGKGFYYNTYLKKDGDFIFYYDFSTKVLRKMIRGNKPRINPATGELIYVDNGGLRGYEAKTNQSRFIFNQFPIEDEEDCAYDISPNGKYAAVMVKMGEFPSGTARQAIFIVDLVSQTFTKIEMKDKSLFYPKFINNSEIVFQIKGLMTAGKDQIFQLENKLYRSDLEGKKITRMFNWD